MVERFSTRQIHDHQSFLVLDGTRILGAVWKAPAPFHDWYWGRVKVNADTYDMMACGVKDSKADAVNACCLEENRRYLSVPLGAD